MIELLVVVVVLGTLSAVVMSTVWDFRGNTESESCTSDRTILMTASEAYRAVHAVQAIPAAGVSPDRYEITLVNAGLIRQPSELHDLDVAGELVIPADSPC